MNVSSFYGCADAVFTIKFHFPNHQMTILFYELWSNQFCQPKIFDFSEYFFQMHLFVFLFIFEVQLNSIASIIVFDVLYSVLYSR